MPPKAAEALLELVRLNGGAEVIERARARLPALPPIIAALDELETIAQTLRRARSRSTSPTCTAIGTTTA